MKKRISKKPLVVVRTYSAGVHIGILERREGKDVELSQSRRLWRWRGANTLNEVATNGVDDEFTRLSEPANVILTEAIEVIHVRERAATSLTRSRWAA